MDRIRSSIKTKIHVESDQLIMYGTTSESPGCVLRGVLDVRVQEPTKVKAISLRFTGKMTITWTEPVSHGHERLYQDERLLINHTWNFLPKASNVHQLDPGLYSYEFELPLPGNLPESTHITSFYLVQYRLKATVQRTRLLPNNNAHQLIHLSRQMLPLTPEFLEPVIVANQWTNKLDYEISIPSKIVSHGDHIPISIRVTPLVSDLRIRHLTCTFKEYMICRASSGWFGGHSRAQGRIIHFTRDDHFGASNSSHNNTFIVWSKVITIPVPRSNHQVQCDVQNDVVRVRHKLKFILSIENPDGHTSELRAALPVMICPKTPVSTGLPSYEETWQTLPYDPALMVSLIHNRSNNNNRNDSNNNNNNSFSGDDGISSNVITSEDEDTISPMSATLPTRRATSGSASNSRRNVERRRWSFFGGYDRSASTTTTTTEDEPTSSPDEDGGCYNNRQGGRRTSRTLQHTIIPIGASSPRPCSVVDLYPVGRHNVTNNSVMNSHLPTYDEFLLTSR
ncbi:hypothetical protein BDC45DRAFT_456609 [Circinella umbellata]|nr:hypothetical protein BDC45DRAFT_456609 [Circinella umbellata]